jgi:hypothetical protein
VKFFQYLDNRFQERQMTAGQPGAPFSLWADADANACAGIMHVTLFFWRLVFVPIVLIGYALACIGLARKPRPLMAEALAQNKQVKKKMAKKLGMEAPQ